MPAIEVADLKQTAVLWMADLSSNAGDDGNQRILSPIEIKVRWEATKGEGDRRKARVVVDREITKGSVLWLGKVANLPTSPEKPKDLMQVTTYDVVPDVNNHKQRKFVDLVLLGSQLPESI